MSDLTEKWKKGELPDGYYYCKTENGMEILRTWGDKYNQLINNLDEVFIKEMSDCKIISEVPSYEEWFKIKNLALLTSLLQEKNIDCLHRENKLKELLKEAKKREDIIRKQLKDAQKVMIEDYSSLDYLKGVLSRQEIGNYTAQESLEKIAHDWEKDLDKYCKKWCEIKY